MAASHRTFASGSAIISFNAGRVEASPIFPKLITACRRTFASPWFSISVKGATADLSAMFPKA